MEVKFIESEKVYKRACTYIPGGVNSPVRSFKSIGITPPFIHSAKGSYIYDIDHNKYMDFCLSWGVHILGHNPAKVMEEVQKALTRGTSYGAPTVEEVELAQLVVNSIDSIEKCRFVNSGTEAVMSALRLARGYTGRKKIIKFDGCYHGHADHLLIKGGSGLNELAESSSQGVPEEMVAGTISIPFNDTAALKQAFETHKNQIAGVIVEPVPANMGVIPPDTGFLQTLREITRKEGALLIFDEVITGFRLGLDGAQGYFNIEPDLTCLGKIIGGGFPVGCFGGKAEIMDYLAPLGPVYQAGTLSGNPVAMSAGAAVLRQLRQPGFYQKLEEKTTIFINALKKAIQNKPVTLQYLGPMFTLFFTGEPVKKLEEVNRCDMAKFAEFYQKMLKENVYLSPSQYEANFISAAHTDEELVKIAETIGAVLQD